MSQSDEDLIVHVLAVGDMQAYGVLIARYQDRVRRTLLRLTAGDRSQADDLAQDTFLKAFDKLSTYRGPGSLGPWLSRIATTQFLQAKRKEGKVRTALAELGSEEQQTSRQPMAETMDLDKALATLKPDERSVIVLCFGEGMSHREVSEATGLPLGTVKSHANRGREKLRQLLGHHQNQEDDHTRGLK